MWMTASILHTYMLYSILGFLVSAAETAIVWKVFSEKWCRVKLLFVS